MSNYDSQLLNRIIGRKKVESHLACHIEKDAAFREELFCSPVTAICKSFDITIPGDISIHVHQENENSAFLVIPFLQESPGNIEELSDVELEAISGGCAATASLIDILANQITRFTISSH